MKVTVKVDKNLCIGSGSCMVIAEEHFGLSKKGKAEVRQKVGGKLQGQTLVLSVTDSMKKKLLEAARACPAQAITLIDEKGNKIRT
jgi:ferredoxin